ncbi:epoxide hydrolase [Trichophyton equinum CBS 127.97]|uniref:Epoxide hydrolase n=1 Tax=Trichophyton equinum (strain ATCC MYA-4606 / CBS 127.97) TaxID=559882 RepID=F2PQW4_TRIEC|nr:epoxide hydrolase [Trichophyton equinum CBS 127.97]
MALDKIQVPGDPRVRHCSTFVNGTTYGYLLATPPDGKYRATIFLIHGFPDPSMGWRYQIPTLLNLGGHDWGGAIVYRIALYEPDFVTHVFSVCTPYWPPSKQYLSLEQTIAKIPFFGYQAQLANGGLEDILRSKEEIRQFLNAMYGGRTTDGKPAISMEKGVLLEKLPDVQPTHLVSEKEMDYYVNEFSRTGLHGPVSWYRTREQNWKDELEFLNESLDIPVLYILATNDTALRPELSRNMERNIKHLTKAEVVASHWALWESPEECNAHIKSWVEGVVFGGKVKL